MTNAIQIVNVRGVFPHLFEPWAGPQGTDRPKYAITMGLTEPQWGQLHQAEEALIAATWPDPASRPPRIERWIRGVAEKPGMFDADPAVVAFVKASSAYLPGVYAPDGTTRIQDKGDARITGGAVYNVHAEPVVYKTPKVGVSWRLYNVQYVKSGPPMGLANPAPNFGAVATDPAYPAPGGGAPGYPPAQVGYPPPPAHGMPPAYQQQLSPPGYPPQAPPQGYAPPQAPPPQGYAPPAAPPQQQQPPGYPPGPVTAAQLLGR